MAKAAAKSTPIWISLFVAYARARKRDLGQVIPALMIQAAIEAGQVRIRAWRYEGRVAGDPNIDAPAFWQRQDVIRDRGPLFNWERSTVRRRCGGWNGKGYLACAVEVVQEDIDALVAAWEPPPAELLPVPVAAPPLHGTKRKVYDLLRHHPEMGSRWIWEQGLKEDVELKTVQNLVSECRKLLKQHSRKPSRKFPEPSR